MTKSNCLSCNILECGKFSQTGLNWRQRVYHLPQRNMCFVDLSSKPLSNSEHSHWQARPIWKKMIQWEEEKLDFSSWKIVKSCPCCKRWHLGQEVLTKMCECTYMCFSLCVFVSVYAGVWAFVHEKPLELQGGQWAFNQAWLKQLLALTQAALAFLGKAHVQPLDITKIFDQL